MDIIPPDLRRAHEDGKVVFFCGAGVSMPAGLPSFKGLVEAVLTDLLPSLAACKPGSTESLAWKAAENDKYDEALDILENPRGGGHEPRDVRERVRHHLTAPRTRTLDNHLMLVRLADLDTTDGRLVTTNFDDLFERALVKLHRRLRTPKIFNKYIAPALPPAKPDTSRGLTYLHGKLDHTEENRGLVLTMADFGMAYLLEGWARQFVVELFRHYHVVFIGYRVDDPTMRYLVSAIAASREGNKHFNEPYAFAPFETGADARNSKDEAEQKWILKGLTPIPYDSANKHQQLWKAIKIWADDHRQGVLGRQQKVAALGQFPPATDDAAEIQELAWALREMPVAKYFANLSDRDRPHQGWISPLQTEGLLSLPKYQTIEDVPNPAPLVWFRLPDGVNLHEVTFQLGRWIARCIDSQEALDWAISQGGVLHSDFRHQIQQALHDAKIDIPTGLRKIWRVLADDGYAHDLSAHHARAFPTHPRLQPNDTFATQIFLGRLRPIPVFKANYSFFRDEQAPEPDRARDWCRIELGLVGIESDYDIDRFRDRANDWNGALAAMAEDITTLLHEAMDWLHEFGIASSEDDKTHMDYRSISPHQQNEHADTWTQLIALAAESYDALVAVHASPAAERLVHRWKSLPYPVFRRLVLYAATGGQNA